jgi:histidyl-tRNA synthetase
MAGFFWYKYGFCLPPCFPPAGGGKVNWIMASKYTSPRGTIDWLPPESIKQLALQSVFTEICEYNCYQPIRTPTFENTELFARGAGESSDIVSKEMYTFDDKKGRSLTLRPEGTPGVVRAMVQAGLNFAEQHRFFYIEPMFRYQRPQKGRYREHTQTGVEIFGAESVTADIEVINLGIQYLTECGLDNLRVAVNSVGTPEDRREYNENLKKFVEIRKDDFCPDCHHRIQHNPMRVFDCKVPGCNDQLRDVDPITESLSEESMERFMDLQDLLKSHSIEFEIDPKLVRGLDYYTHTVFEIMMMGDDSQQGTLLGGGRYDGLVELYGGPATPAIGFGSGVERVCEAIDWEEHNDLLVSSCEVAVIGLGPEPLKQAVTIASELRANGIVTHIDHRGKSIKAQLGQANTLGSELVLIIGEVELNDGVAIVKEMKSGDQENVEFEEIVDYVINYLSRPSIEFN